MSLCVTALRKAKRMPRAPVAESRGTGLSAADSSRPEATRRAPALFATPRTGTLLHAKIIQHMLQRRAKDLCR